MADRFAEFKKGAEKLSTEDVDIEMAEKSGMNLCLIISLFDALLDNISA